jgi:ATP-dependent helicase HepA
MALRFAHAGLKQNGVFVLEAVADSRWHVDQFLAPTPVRVVVDLRRNDLTEDYPAAGLADDFVDGTLHRFLEQPGFNVALLKAMVEFATERGDKRSRALVGAAQNRATTALAADWQRLVDLQKLNDHIRPEEIALAREQLERTTTAIAQARLRLDSLRLIVEGPGGED